MPLGVGSSEGRVAGRLRRSVDERGAIVCRVASAWLLAGATALAAPAGAAAADDPCHDWSDVVSLSGKVVARTVAGPLGSEGMEEGDAPLTGLFLELEAPLCLRNGDLAAGQDDLDGLTALHLIVDEVPEQLRSGMHVRLTGTFMERHTRYHLTPALFIVRQAAQTPR